MTNITMQRWHKISKDPNAPLVMKARQEELQAARTGQLISNRIDYFCQLVKNKTILDVGVVEHTQTAVQSSTWLHKHLSQAAKSCIGVDILETEVEHLQSLGFNIICADITQHPLDQSFDVILCGEILEHIDASGAFFKSAAKMLNPDGKLVISVPNPWYINVILKSSFGRIPYVDNADHVAWFDPCTLCELGQRHGLKLDRFTGIGVEIKESLGLKAKVFFRLMPLMIRLGLRSELFAKSIIYEFVLSPQPPQQKEVDRETH
ncbi:MAG: class I SAM-dependent methyltransferase [Oculatellaceae cyanobacterium bins.114]|nr:class I SAM-dependent methyltransferase [Oculatellaceae cyanobacterium bins.114]